MAAPVPDTQHLMATRLRYRSTAITSRVQA